VLEAWAPMNATERCRAFKRWGLGEGDWVMTTTPPREKINGGLLKWVVSAGVG
jgi:hypothetical protein